MTVKGEARPSYTVRERAKKKKKKDRGERRATKRNQKAEKGERQGHEMRVRQGGERKGENPDI